MKVLLNHGTQANLCKMVVINNNTIFRCITNGVGPWSSFVVRVALCLVYAGTYDDKCWGILCVIVPYADKVR